MVLGPIVGSDYNGMPPPQIIRIALLLDPISASGGRGSTLYYCTAVEQPIANLTPIRSVWSPQRG